VSWLFQVARTGRFEFFQQTERHVRRLNGETRPGCGSLNTD